jgi:DNA repair protein RecO (recombination protein O)
VLEERAPQLYLYRLLAAGLETLDGAQASAPLVEELEGAGPDPLPAEPQRLLRYMEMALLHELGYAPVLDACAECGDPLPQVGLRYSARLGGLLDRHCGSGGGAMAVQPRSAKLLRLLAYRASGRSLLPDGRLALELFASTEVPEGVGRELAQALQDTIEYHLDRRLRSLEFMRGLGAAG